MDGAEDEYCRLRVVERAARADAFMRAFGREELDRSTASKYAWRLEQKKAVGERMAALAARLDDEALLSRADLMRRVLARAENAEKDADALRGYDLYAKLAGFAAQEATTQVNVMPCSFAAIMAAVEGKGNPQI